MEKKALANRRVSRRSFLQAAAATAGVMVTAACVAPTTGAAIDSGGDADMESVELRLTSWGFQVEKHGKLQQKAFHEIQNVQVAYSASPSYQEKQGKLRQAFHDAHPHINLQEDFISSYKYWPQMRSAAAAGELPDIMHHFPYYYVQFAHSGVTIPLDPFIERDGVDLNDFYEGSITQGRWQPGQIRCGSGDLHAFPTSWHSGTVWFYDKNWFAEMGIPEPDESWTWDTIVEAGKEFTVINDDGSAESYGMDAPIDGNGRMNFWIFQAGGAFYDEEYNGCLIKDDEPMEAFQWMVDLINEHKVAMPPEVNQFIMRPQSPSCGDGKRNQVWEQCDDGNRIDDDGCSNSCRITGTPGKVAIPPEAIPQFKPFGTARVAFAVMGGWMIPYFSAIEDFEWDIFTPPSHPVTGMNTIDAYQNGISITSTSEYTDESWEYIKWLTMGDGAAMYAETIFPFPAHIPTAERLIYAQDRTDPPTQLWILNQLLKDATPVFNGPAEDEIAGIAVEEQVAAMLQIKTVAEATDALESRVNAVLERARKVLLG